VKQLFDVAYNLIEEYRGDSADLRQAEAALDELLKIDPTHAPAYREIARIRIKSGHLRGRQFMPGTLEAAEASIQKAIEIRPAYAEAYVLMGHVYFLMGRLDDATTVLRRAEEIGTDDPWLHNNWADVLVAQGNAADALARYQRVLDSGTTELGPLIGAIEGAIRLHRAFGRIVEPDLLFRRQIEVDPASAWGFGNYAEFLLCDLGSYGASTERARQALAIMDYGVGRYWLAASLYAQWAHALSEGRHDESVAAFEEAQELVPDPRRLVDENPMCKGLDHVRPALDQMKPGAE
jgi:tetratricopeptide (TPR) repeat protein